MYSGCYKEMIYPRGYIELLIIIQNGNCYGFTILFNCYSTLIYTMEDTAVTAEVI